MFAAGENLAANYLAMRERIERAARRAGRKADEITLVGASKTVPVESVREAYACGVREFGENRVQEWEKKEPLLRELKAKWHLIGHLQSNKAGRAARLFDAVDSVDSITLARKLDAALAESSEASGGKRLRVLIEVRVGEEETKSGANESEVGTIAEEILRLERLELGGLMCMPPYCEDPAEARPYFSKLRRMRDTLAQRIGKELPVLSMGMSHDFEVAIEEGATEVRLGAALFGARQVYGAEGAA